MKGSIPWETASPLACRSCVFCPCPRLPDSGSLLQGTLTCWQCPSSAVCSGDRQQDVPAVPELPPSRAEKIASRGAVLALVPAAVLQQLLLGLQEVGTSGQAGSEHWATWPSVLSLTVARTRCVRGSEQNRPVVIQSCHLLPASGSSRPMDTQSMGLHLRPS